MQFYNGVTLTSPCLPRSPVRMDDVESSTSFVLFIGVSLSVTVSQLPRRVPRFFFFGGGGGVARRRNFVKTTQHDGDGLSAARSPPPSSRIYDECVSLLRLPPPPLRRDRIQIKFFVAVIHMQESTHKVPKSAPQAVLTGLQLTVHATHRTRHGDSRLVHAMSALSAKTRHSPPQYCRDVGAMP